MMHHVVYFEVNCFINQLFHESTPFHELFHESTPFHELFHESTSFLQVSEVVRYESCSVCNAESYFESYSYPAHLYESYSYRELLLQSETPCLDQSSNHMMHRVVRFEVSYRYFGRSDLFGLVQTKNNQSY